MPNHTLVGKLDGERIHVLSEDHWLPSNSEPMGGDVVEINGRIWAYRNAWARQDVTREFADLAGWEMPEFALEYEDVL
jgi:hypothetical protein